VANNWMAYNGRITRDGDYPLPCHPTNRGRLRGDSTMKFVIYRDKKREFRWQLLARNGRIIADSAESYKRKSQVAKMITKIIMGPHKIVE